MRGDLETALGTDLAPRSTEPPKEPNGHSPRSPYRTTLAAFFWIGLLVGGVGSIIAWNAGTAGLIWLELGLGLVGFASTSGMLWLVVSALTWRPRGDE